MPSKSSFPFLAFACVGEVDGDADFAVSTTVRVGVEVQYPLQGGSLPEERELRGRTTDNNNLKVLNNFNGRDLSKIKKVTY